MEARAYLKRIGYQGSLNPSLQALKSLHRRHLLSVPFENLDIHTGRPIILDIEAFYDKLVNERRGGYCYELNACFAWLLKKLGFRVAMLSAKVAIKDRRFSPEFDHMTLLVSLRERWLADVGFGDSFTEPKQIDTGRAQEDSGRTYRLGMGNQTRVLLRYDESSESWQPQYSFTLRPRRLSDFAQRNLYQQTSPNSHFTQGPLISKLTRTGRVTLTDKKLIITRGELRTQYRVKTVKEFRRLLAKNFRIGLDTRESVHQRMP